MNMINPSTVDSLVFLNGIPVESDKIHWKRAYATYLLVTHKTPEECANKSLQLTELLPILGSLDRKWKLVEPEMMVSTHKMVHRMKITLNRFRREPKKVYDAIY